MFFLVGSLFESHLWVLLENISLVPLQQWAPWPGSWGFTNDLLFHRIDGVCFHGSVETTNKDLTVCRSYVVDVD